MVAKPHGGPVSALSANLFPKTIVLIVLTAVLLSAMLLIYPAAREYYISLRDLESANTELELVEGRNAEVQELIDWLSTDSGVEDYIRREYGWVKEGETAGVVTGLLDTDDSNSLPSVIQEGSVTAEDTLLNEILDVIFMVNDD